MSRGDCCLCRLAGPRSVCDASRFIALRIAAVRPQPCHDQRLDVRAAYRGDGRVRSDGDLITQLAAALRVERE